MVERSNKVWDVTNEIVIVTLVYFETQYPLDASGESNAVFEIDEMSVRCLCFVVFIRLACLNRLVLNIKFTHTELVPHNLGDVLLLS